MVPTLGFKFIQKSERFSTLAEILMTLSLGLNFAESLWNDLNLIAIWLAPRWRLYVGIVERGNLRKRCQPFNSAKRERVLEVSRPRQ